MSLQGSGICDKLDVTLVKINVIYGGIDIFDLSNIGIVFDIIKYSAIISFLLLIAIYNQRTLFITHRGVLILFLMGVVFRLLECIFMQSITPFLTGLASGFVIGVIPYIIAITFQELIGGGDVKLWAVIGFCCGWNIGIIALIVAVLLLLTTFAVFTVAKYTPHQPLSTGYYWFFSVTLSTCFLFYIHYFHLV
jgi:Flp pilus assembly protein protease CpaA